MIYMWLCHRGGGAVDKYGLDTGGVHSPGKLVWLRLRLTQNMRPKSIIVSTLRPRITTLFEQDTWIKHSRRLRPRPTLRSRTRTIPRPTLPTRQRQASRYDKCIQYSQDWV